MQIKTLLLDYLKVDKAKYITLILVAALGLFDYMKMRNQLRIAQTKERQADGFLSEKERKLTQQNAKLNITNSKLVQDVEVFKTKAKNYRLKYQKSINDFDTFSEKNDLVLQEYKSTIHTLKQKVKVAKSSPAKTKVIIKQGECSEDTQVAYSFTDQYSRLYFSTPNCLVKGEEEYVLDQAFSIYAEVYQQEDGLLKVSTVNLNELNPDNHSEVIASAKLISSDFRYFPVDLPSPTYEKLTLSIGADQGFAPNIGLGYNWFSYRSLYFNTSVNFTNQQRFFPSLNIIYRPNFLTKPLNFGVFAGLGYEFSTDPTYLLGVSFFAW